MVFNNIVNPCGFDICFLKTLYYLLQFCALADYFSWTKIIHYCWESGPLWLWSKIININHGLFPFAAASFHSWSFERRHFHTTSCYTKDQQRPHKTTNSISTGILWKTLKSWDYGHNHVIECVCATNNTLCSQRHSVKTHNQQQSHNNFTKRTNTHIQASEIQISTETHNQRDIWQEVWNILRKKQHPYLFLKIGKEVRENMKILCVNMVILKERKRNRIMNS